MDGVQDQGVTLFALCIAGLFLVTGCVGIWQTLDEIAHSTEHTFSAQNGQLAKFLIYGLIAASGPVSLFKRI